MFESEDHKITFPVKLQGDTVWLTRNQMAELFDRDVKTIGKHINNALKEEADLFGREKDDSFKGSIRTIYQSFDGQDLYPTLEEKAARLLYFVTKNQSFVDGNKRIVAAIFLYFLDKNGVLFIDGKKLINDYTLVALTIMIAESRPGEMEMMITVTMNCLK